MIDGVSACLKANKDVRRMLWRIQSIAALVHAVDQRPFLTGQQQPAVAKDLPAVRQSLSGIDPWLLGNVAGRRGGDPYIIAPRFRKELQRRVVCCFLEDLIGFEIYPAVQVMASGDGITQALPIFVCNPQARSDETEAPALVEQRDTLFNKGQIEIKIAGLRARIGRRHDPGPALA